jgi:hypothetical protein
MGVHDDGTLAAFFQRLRRSPVRWVVLFHAVLLATAIALQSMVPRQAAIDWLVAPVAIAQIALALIWMNLDGRMTARRTVGVAFVIAVVQLLDSPGPRPEALLGLICLVPGLFIMLTVLSIPLGIAHSLGLQLHRFEPGNMPPPRRMQFSIRAALIASVVVAVLFGLKGVVSNLGTTAEPIGMSIGGALALVVMILVVVTIYLSIPLVAVWAVLTPGPILPRLATAIVGWSLAGLLLLHYMQPGEGSLQFTFPSATTAGAIPIVIATLLVLRQMGYRAVWFDRDTWLVVEEFEVGSPFEPRGQG